MYDIPQDLISALQSTPTVLAALLSVHRQPPADDWGPVEIVCHLRDAEERALERMRAMRDQDNPPIEGYNPEDWVTERDYAGTSLESALDDFNRFRAQHLAELKALSPADWQRQGLHSEHGPMDILNHTQHMAAHDVVHLAQLAILPPQGNSPPWFGS